MSENVVHRRIIGRERVEVAEGWRELHNEEHHNFYSLSFIILYGIRSQTCLETLSKIQFTLQ